MDFGYFACPEEANSRTKKNDKKARFHRFVFANLFIAAKSYIHLICFNSNFDNPHINQIISVAKKTLPLPPPSPPQRPQLFTKESPKSVQYITSISLSSRFSQNAPTFHKNCT